MRKSAFTITLLGGIVLFAGTAAATERHVPSQYETIQEAINDCNNGDTVIVEPGYYYENLDFLGKAITVRSTDPNDPETVGDTFILCYGRGFIFDSGEGPNSVVSGFSIYGGNADNGGAIYCNGSSPTISHCVIIESNASENGGGIYCNGGSPTISYCTIGLYGQWNSAKNGGGIYLNYSDATISHCTIQYNRATDGSGGGIYCYGTGNPKINNCIIKNNTAEPFYGGGIFCRESSPTISNSIVHSNWCEGQRSIIISAPQGGGGGICCQSCDAKIVNCTVADNETDGSAGGVYCYWGGEVTVGNSIIWDNSILEYGPEIGVGGGPDGGGALMTISYSDVKGGQSNAYIGWWASLNWDSGNINSDPCFADSSNGDYHLKSIAGRWNPSSESWVTDAVTSQCIDAGNPGCPLGDEPSDANNVRINMGAYGGTEEASKTPVDWRSIADLDNDWVVDFNDLAAFVSYWLDSGECIPSDLDRDESVDFADYAIFAREWPGADIPPAEPGIEFQISPCQMYLSSTGQLGETRFTVTVEGRRIHFEDMMSANCCAKELWLEMTVEDNLITVYENEWGGYCLCICDYPVTATLGPFEAGTYTLEVYEDFGGFIGSTTVIIE
jgi:parallel beta-helix repeat protein